MTKKKTLIDMEAARRRREKAADRREEMDFETEVREAIKVMGKVAEGLNQCAHAISVHGERLARLEAQVLGVEPKHKDGLLLPGRDY